MLRKILLLSLLIILIFTRFAFLSYVPSGISNDELDYVLNAKSIFLSGSDISHTWNPLTFTTPKSSFPQAEIPPLLTFLSIGPFPLSLFWSKIPYALVSILTVLLVYAITRKLIGEKEAIVVALLASINPWLIFFGRSAYDTPVSLFFFLLSWYFLLILKKWKILFVFPFLFIGFYTYIGFKIIFLPFAFITIFYSWWIINKKKYTKQYLILLLLCISLFSIYAFFAFHSSGQRINEISTPNMSRIIEQTNIQRRLSINSPINLIFSNKYAIFFKDSFDTYLNVFSPNFLFLHGDNKYLFSLYQHGVFYLIDILFILIGFASLFSRDKKVLLLLCGLILIAPLPSVVSNLDITYAIRSMLLAPLLCILAGVGIWTVISGFKKDHKVWITILVVFLYIISFINFLNIYFLRNPIYNSESFSFESRVMSKYLSFQTNPVYVVDSNPRTPLKQYLFYTNQLNRKTDNLVAQMYATDLYKFKLTNFLPCSKAESIPKGSIIITNDLECKGILVSKNVLNIVQLSDAGTIYKIYNDTLCQKYTLSRYPSNINFTSLNVESLSVKDLCQRFIIKF